MELSNVPTPTATKLLTQLLDETLAAHGVVSAARFRLDNFEFVQVLDDLESSELLKKVDGNYVVSPLALPLIPSDVARARLSGIEQIYAILRDHYKRNLGQPVSVSQLSVEASAPRERVAADLAIMVDVPLWWQRHATRLTADDAFVVPSEGVWKYATFRDLIEQVLEWRRTSSVYPGPTPSLVADTASADEVMTTRESAARGDSGQALLEAWPAIRACLQELTFYSIKEVAGLAGLDVTAIADLVQEKQGNKAGASKGQLMSAVDGQFGQMSPSIQKRFLTITVEEVLRRRQDFEDRLSEYLSRVGWSFTNRTLVPLEVFDPANLAETPEESHRDLLKAAQRLRDGDLTGAVSAACGAVDSATALIYQQAGLGDPTRTSFQERCRVATRSRGVLTELDEQLEALGWSENEIAPLRKNLEGALNQGAYVMQTLRSRMGDVHGSKPILRPLVFDCLRWAELLVATLVERRAR